MCRPDFGIKRSKVNATAGDDPENRVNAILVTIGANFTKVYLDLETY